MNEQAIVEKMITFIEKKERELQANKMNADNRAKNDIIKSIMDELERETTNENSEEAISLTCAVIKREIGLPLTKEEKQKEKQISEKM